MAADCKSAAPWSYGGSNPLLCTSDSFELKQSRIISPRLVLALAAYAVLAAFAWSTMDPTWFESRFGEIQPRLFTVVILALLAFRTVLHAIRINRESEA